MGIPPLGNRIGNLGAPLPAGLSPNVAAVAAFGNPATKFGNPITSAQHLFARQVHRSVQGRRPDLLRRPEPVRPQRLCERWPDKSGRELRGGIGLADLPIVTLRCDLSSCSPLDPGGCAVVTGRRHRRSSPRPYRPRSRLAPTSRSCSPAAPASPPASAGSARPLPTRWRPSSGTQPWHLRRELPSRLRLSDHRRRRQRRDRAHRRHGAAVPGNAHRARRLLTGCGRRRHAGRRAAPRQQDRRDRIGAATARRIRRERRRSRGIRQSRNEVREPADGSRRRSRAGRSTCAATATRSARTAATRSPTRVTNPLLSSVRRPASWPHGFSAEQ